MGSPQQFILGFKMKWTLCLLCVASVAAALPARDKKAFSLFSVVTFPNAECTTDTTPAMTGICVTAEECSNDGDVIAQAQGNCASGFGVCCMRRVEGNPNAAITSGLTYVQSAGFPQAVTALNPTAAGAAVAAVQRDFNIMGGPNVCQIRFDFITVQTLNSAATGSCAASDSISINTPTRTASQTGVTALCGTLTGQHLIDEVAPGTNAMAATLNIDTAPVAGARMWKILVKCVECDSNDRSPPGCNQFFTEASGRFSSFNGAQARTDGLHTMLQNLDYSICFRQIPGMCGVRLTQTRPSPGDNPDSFGLATAAATVAATTATGTTGCTFQFLRVPDAVVLTALAAMMVPMVENGRVCGGILDNQAGVVGQTASGAIDNMVSKLVYFLMGKLLQLLALALIY